MSFYEEVVKIIREAKAVKRAEEQVARQKSEEAFADFREKVRQGIRPTRRKPSRARALEKKPTEDDRPRSVPPNICTHDMYCDGKSGGFGRHIQYD